MLWKHNWDQCHYDKNPTFGLDTQRQTRINNAWQELPLIFTKRATTAWTANTNSHFFPLSLPYSVHICGYFSTCEKKLIINIPFLCFPTSLWGWQLKDDNFLLTFSILLPFISIRIHIFNLILLLHFFTFESMVYFSLQDDQFCQALLSLKNNLFHFSSAYFLSAFSVPSFLLCIYFSSIFFFLHHSSASYPTLINTISTLLLFTITFPLVQTTQWKHYLAWFCTDTCNTMWNSCFMRTLSR